MAAELRKFPRYDAPVDCTELSRQELRVTQGRVLRRAAGKR
jgi:hypothetical protein